LLGLSVFKNDFKQEESNMSKKLFFMSIILLVLFGGMLSAENLLKNPSFEEPILAAYNTQYFRVPTDWRLIRGGTGTAGPYMFWLTEGLRPATDGRQWVSLPSQAVSVTVLGQDIGPIEPDSIYTFRLDVCPRFINALSGQGKISLQTYEGDRYIVLAQSKDFVESGLTVERFNKGFTLSWDSTDYPQAWGKTLVAAIHVNQACNFFFDNCSLTKSPSGKKIRVARDVPDAFISISENGATHSFNIELLAPPTSNVSVVLDPNSSQVDAGAGAGAAMPVLFTPSNWNTPQKVTLAAVDDGIEESTFLDTIYLSVDTSDPAYSTADPNNALSPLMVKVVDNDGSEWQGLYDGSFEIPAIIQNANVYGPPAGWFFLPMEDSSFRAKPLPTHEVQPTEGVVRYTAYSDIMQPVGSLIEANTGYVFEMDVRGTFSSSPGYESLKIVCYDNSDVLDPSNIVVLASKSFWEVAKTSSQWYRVYCTWHSDTAPQYVGKKLGVIVAVQNNMTRLDNGSIKQSFINLVESNDTTVVWEKASLGNSDTYSISITRQPSSSVVITATPAADAEGIDLGAGIGIPVTLTFDSTNWQTPQIITVTAVDDLSKEGAVPKIYTISHTTVSSDPYFSEAYVKEVNVAVHDDDYPAILFEDAVLEVSETGMTSDVYSVYLQIAPTSDVTIFLTADEDVTVNPSQLVFTTDNWATPQTVTVTAVDDKLTQGNPHMAVITHTISSDDTAYALLTAVKLNVTVLENDFCGEWGYLSADLNQDCYVNLDDFQLLASSWLECTNPGDLDCIQP